MLRQIIAFTLIFIATYASAASVQDSTGLPGDHFSLEGAMDLFKSAASPEDFEKQLNNPDNPVNNLDLNEDGQVDYIRVEDIMDREVHALVLRTDISADETQDIAVIEIEKTGPEEAVAQIIGDSALYEGSPIVEPYETVEDRGSSNGPSPSLHIERIIVNVWFWPSVRFVYAPVYRPWRSPWHWAYYPGWWRPWRPYPWYVFHPRVRRYHVHYRVVPHHRVVRAHRLYTPRRKASVSVVKKTTVIKTHQRKSSGVMHKKTTTVGVKKTNGKVTVGKKTTTIHKTKTPSGQKTTKKSKTVSRNSNGKVTRTKTKSTSVKHKNKKGGTTKVSRTKTKKVTKKKRK